MSEKGFRAKFKDSDVAVTFRDLILLPGWTEVEPNQVQLSTQVSQKHSINIPLVSSPMDTVTESEMAIGLARLGGLGVIHRNCTTEEELEMAKKVKRAESLVIKEVITISPDATVKYATELMQKNNISGLPVVQGEHLVGILTGRDVRFADSNLLTSDVMTKKVLEEVNTDVVVGSIGTYQAAEDILTKLDGVAGFRVGIGSGSICTTMEATKAGSPTVFATAQVADALRTYGSKLPIIADGGIRGPGDAAIALSLGASAVMMGNIFARSKEAPGTLITIGGRYYKQYRGMGSPSAMAKRFSSDRYAQPSKGLPEGVEGWVPYKGELSVVVQEMVAGLQASMGYAGAITIPELWEKSKLAGITNSGAEEARPHDVLLPSESPERV